MNINYDDIKNIELYRKLLAENGHSYKALDWGSRESQMRRFEVLSEIGIKANDEILDNGCGLADFYKWLITIKPDISYSGIDITPEMVQAACARFPHLDIRTGSLLNKEEGSKAYDYVISSGIFFYRQVNPEKYMKEMIQAMFDRAKKGIAFNSLSSWGPKKPVGEFSASPSRIVEFCYSLSSYVVLRHDYHPADFTIYIYKSNSTYKDSRK